MARPLHHRLGPARLRLRRADDHLRRCTSPAEGDSCQASAPNPVPGSRSSRASGGCPGGRGESGDPGLPLRHPKLEAGRVPVLPDWIRGDQAEAREQLGSTARKSMNCHSCGNNARGTLASCLAPIASASRVIFLPKFLC